ncbi:Allergen V5/Tpx-1-related protein [Metarhizium album ARSEF 1941]|uniref:Allergen V5/Tpx-1-related protein n=1 Tax=Metarhizium album (strain ARSEF 1941) TaxID=1081103 RepID=A0A0B2X4C0_METAS|nr:Allergen V5/Tpx-1-related protein [Metarhizium album ARSEF 1941]KHO01199.1 Allergen V5/Tpx-1-related protein [Metarhizium album ARSEF 1941]
MKSGFFAFALSLLAAPVLSVAVRVVRQLAIPHDEPQWAMTDKFTSAILESTNLYRQQHNAPDLTWNETLASFATGHLERSDCEFKHSGGPYGENLALGFPNVTASVEAWGNERDKFDWENFRFQFETGHFTQLVWKTTTSVGCDRRVCAKSGWYLACEYWPRGNVQGQYRGEVETRVPTPDGK